MEFNTLIEAAKKINHPRKIANNAYAGSVAAALEAANGKIYTGVCIDTMSGMGFCAEHSAIAQMIADGESKIIKIVAIKNEEILHPCGRCREFINQVHDENKNTLVMIDKNKVVKLSDLLPY